MGNITHKCPICEIKYTDKTTLINHIEENHSGLIPKDMSAAQYYYYLKTGREHGRCVICKGPTPWNEATGKYCRMCGKPACKQKYLDTFSKNMIGAHGKVRLLDDPEQQKKMLANRRISGVYTWSTDEHYQFNYTGKLELDFITLLDLFLSWNPDDIMMPSPHTYYYEYEGVEKFYIPDVFIPSIDLEIEIKDGGTNPNMHHKIQDVDKVKEKLKDKVLMSQKAFHYVKLHNKDYTNFFMLLNKLKEDFAKNGENKYLERIFLIEDHYAKKITVDKYVSESVNQIATESLSKFEEKDDAVSKVKYFIGKTSADSIYGIMHGGAMLTEYTNQEKAFVNANADDSEVLKEFRTHCVRWAEIYTDPADTTYRAGRMYSKYLKTELIPLIDKYIENPVQESWNDIDLNDSIVVEENITYGLFKDSLTTKANYANTDNLKSNIANIQISYNNMIDKMQSMDDIKFIRKDIKNFKTILMNLRANKIVDKASYAEIIRWIDYDVNLRVKNKAASFKSTKDAVTAGDVIKQKITKDDIYVYLLYDQTKANSLRYNSFDNNSSITLKIRDAEINYFKVKRGNDAGYTPLKRTINKYQNCLGFKIHTSAKNVDKIYQSLISEPAFVKLDNHIDLKNITSDMVKEFITKAFNIETEPEFICEGKACDIMKGDL